MALRYAFAAWESVTLLLIGKCFCKSGFVRDEETMGEDDDVPLAQLIADIQDSIPLVRLRGTGLLNPSSVAGFVSVDNDIVTTEERTEDDIIA